MAEKSILIIGAGIAGLSAGCYAQMNGYRSQIFEMHSIPCGLCTAWTRKGYTFDGCIHHLAGASPRSSLYRLWEELGAVQDRPMVYHDYLVQVGDPDDLQARPAAVCDQRALTATQDPKGFGKPLGSG